MKLLVIDPARRIPELECFNAIALQSQLPATYHLPAMFGMQSLSALDMRDARGIIILGSASSVNERSPWQIALEAWLMPHLERGVPTLGLCYGHQMLAYMFGGKVDYLFPDKHKHKGLRDISLETTSCWKKCAGSVVVSHNEGVTSVPPAMQIIASSPEVKIDGLAHKNLPIWSLQSHPEATPEFLTNHDIHLEHVPQALAFGQSLVASFLKYVSKSAQ